MVFSRKSISVRVESVQIRRHRTAVVVQLYPLGKRRTGELIEKRR
jgi:hypothetical protein